jgi:NADP-dependent 3-hydroxy acid dehydrogenase YdfG
MGVFATQFALVTGAGGGIGRAICRALAGEGAYVWAVGRSADTLAETVSGCHGRAKAHVADLTDDVQVNCLAASVEREFGRVDVLVHSAGIIAYGSVAESPIDMLDAQYRSNLRAPYRITQSMLPFLRKRPGQIVFVNSSIVSGGARPNTSQFAATQHAVKAVAESLRLEVNTDGIRVLCVYPGRTATSRQARLYEEQGQPYRPEMLLQPEDLATMVVAALSLPSTAEVTDIYIRPMLKSY